MLIHAGYGARPLVPALSLLADAVPGARLILAHGARGDARAVRTALAAHPGVWFDTSLAALADLVDLPPERLVFGSDRPYGDYATGTAAGRVRGARRRVERGPAARGACPATSRRSWGPKMRRTDALRLVAALGAIEMALVRRDEVAGPLLAQAARAAAGTPVDTWLAEAARLVRAPEFFGDAPPAQAARRKVVQALCRASAQAVQAELLEGPHEPARRHARSRRRS